MEPLIKDEGKYITLIDLIKGSNHHIRDSHYCKQAEAGYNLKHIPNTGAIQVRCAGCGRFLGNVKYDERYMEVNTNAIKTVPGGTGSKGT